MDGAWTFCNMVPVPSGIPLGSTWGGGVVNCDLTCSFPFASEISSLSVIISVSDDGDGILKTLHESLVHFSVQNGVS